MTSLLCLFVLMILLYVSLSSSPCTNHSVLSDIPIREAYSPDVKRELLMLSLPAIVGQAIDPIAMLMETAYIGRLGMLHSMKQVE